MALVIEAAVKLTKKLPSWHKQLRQILPDRRFEAERREQKRSHWQQSRIKRWNSVRHPETPLAHENQAFFRILLANFKLRSIRSINIIHQSLKHGVVWVFSFGPGAIAKEDFGTFRRAIAILFSRRFGVKLDADVTAPRPQAAG